jgi:hypothetical protein
MSKDSRKNPLNEEQKKTLNRVHALQKTLEIALVILFLATITANIWTVFPAYGIFALLVMLLAGLLVFGVGIAITLCIFSMKRLGANRTRSAKRWVLMTWLSVALIIFLIILGTTSVNAGAIIFISALVGITLLFTFCAVICTLISAHLMWRRFNKKKRAPVRVILYGILAFSLMILALFGSYTTTEAIKYNSISVTDSNLELGQTEVRQTGRDGQKQIKHSLVLGVPVSESSTDPIDEQIAKGSRRYQYMYCSSGSWYYYYTAEQFKNPNAGYTHQSPDDCAKNGKGTQTTLADVPPAEKIIQQAPVYRGTTYTTCTESY